MGGSSGTPPASSPIGRPGYAAAPMDDSGGDAAAVSAANDAFYRAFEGAELAAMDRVWEHSDRVSCTHPGMPAVHGWDAVRLSWEAILGGGGVPQFIVTEEQVTVVGDAAWVVGVENMILPGGSGAGSVVNTFVRGDQGWLMVGHHGAPISRPAIG